jgi:hypothetical protein
MSKPKKYDRVLSGEFNHDLDQRLLSWYRDENGESRPMKCGFYRELRRLWPHTATDKDKADFVVECREIIETARAISAGGGGHDRLKPLADAARNLIWEIPETIPRNGFHIDEPLEYHSSLSLAEIEEKLFKELERCNLLEWFELTAGAVQ